MKNVAIMLADGFEEVEALTVVDVLRRGQISCKMVSVTSHLEVKGAHQIEVKADCLFSQVDFTQIDMVVLPGGRPGTDALLACEPLLAVLEEFDRQGKYIGAICAAPWILGTLGIVKGREATCYPGFESYLVGAKMVNRKVAIAKNVITSNGMGSALLFALTLLAVLTTVDQAVAVEQEVQKREGTSVQELFL